MLSLTVLSLRSGKALLEKTEKMMEDSTPELEPLKEKVADLRDRLQDLVDTAGVTQVQTDDIDSINQINKENLDHIKVCEFLYRVYHTTYTIKHICHCRMNSCHPHLVGVMETLLLGNFVLARKLIITLVNLRISYHKPKMERKR